MTSKKILRFFVSFSTVLEKVLFTNFSHTLLRSKKKRYWRVKKGKTENHRPLRPPLHHRCKNGVPLRPPVTLVLLTTTLRLSFTKYGRFFYFSKNTISSSDWISWFGLHLKNPLYFTLLSSCYLIENRRFSQSTIYLTIKIIVVILISCFRGLQLHYTTTINVRSKWVLSLLSLIILD